jgi:hypothetical protein
MKPIGGLPLWRMTLRAALGYFGTVFVVAFAAGALRTLLVAPRLGEVPAVLIEVPLILMVSWVFAGRVLRRWPVAVGGAPALLAMGAIAFSVLMAAEAGLATLAFGRPFEVWLDGLTTPAGLTGLAGQIGFALIPWLRGR